MTGVAECPTRRPLLPSALWLKLLCCVGLSLHGAHAVKLVGIKSPLGLWLWCTLAESSSQLWLSAMPPDTPSVLWDVKSSLVEKDWLKHSGEERSERERENRGRLKKVKDTKHILTDPSLMLLCHTLMQSTCQWAGDALLWFTLQCKAGSLWRLRCLRYISLSLIQASSFQQLAL